ncbi:MAG TPA: TlpA disulfide reductase family protein [Myxococcaceae bacterium]|nr:TlpA disulfide reductase family protein [Myxococcaceae bacterium]
MRLRAAWLALVLIAVAGCRRAQPTPPSFPDYRSELGLPAVGPVRFDPAEITTHPVIIVFFATWCMPCLGQLQFLSAIQREYAARGLRVVAIGMDIDGKKVLEPFAVQSALPYPILVADPSFLRGESAFGPIRELPAVLMVNAKGKPIAAWTGFAEPASLRQKVEELTTAQTSDAR